MQKSKLKKELNELKQRVNGGELIYNLLSKVTDKKINELQKQIDELKNAK